MDPTTATIANMFATMTDDQRCDWYIHRATGADVRVLRSAGHGAELHLSAASTAANQLLADMTDSADLIAAHRARMAQQ